MTKAYLMGLIAATCGKEAYSYSNPWWNPFGTDGYIESDKESFDEFMHGYDQGKTDRNGLESIIQLAKPQP